MTLTEDKRRALVAREVYVNQTMLVDTLLVKGILSLGDIENLSQDECGEWNMPYEWWVVSDWFLKELRFWHEPVLVCDLGAWWGRTTTGQAIWLDSTVKVIAKAL